MGPPFDAASVFLTAFCRAAGTPFFCPPFAANARSFCPPFAVRQPCDLSARLLLCGSRAIFLRARTFSKRRACGACCLRRRRPFTTKVCVTFFLLFRRMTFSVCAPFGKAAKASPRKKASPVRLAFFSCTYPPPAVLPGRRFCFNRAAFCKSRRRSSAGSNPQTKSDRSGRRRSRRPNTGWR